MTLRYAWPQANVNKSTGVKVKVNGSYLQENGEDLFVPMTSTLSWNMYNNLSVTLPGMLPGPNNTVLLESDGVSNQSIRVDAVIFTREESIAGGDVVHTFEAEAPGNVLLGNPGNEAFVGYHSNAQNGAYVTGLNKSNAGVEWPDLDITVGGAALLRIYYANGSTGSVTKAVGVNGVIESVTFPETNSWNAFTGVVETTVQLNGDGTDDIRIWRESNPGQLRIDYIEIETVPVSATIQLLEEAEGNEFGQAIQGTDASASGGAYVDRLNKSASGVEWTELQAPVDMQATLRFAYANGSGSDSLKMLVVNGQSQLIHFPATTGWKDFTGIVELAVDLAAGANTIRLWRDDAGIDALRIDYMELVNQ